MNEDDYFVGRKVVALHSRKDRSFIKGQVYTILELGRTPCCGKLLLKIGNNNLDYEFSVCSNCDGMYKYEEKYLATCFRPLDEDEGDMFIEEFIEEYITV